MFLLFCHYTRFLAHPLAPSGGSISAQKRCQGGTGSYLNYLPPPTPPWTPDPIEFQQNSTLTLAAYGGGWMVVPDSSNERTTICSRPCGSRRLTSP